MLEGLAAWVLNTYLGEYVENLNQHQLSIGFLSGAVELENLPLRKDALKELDLPLEVKAGYIGRIKLQIPVRHLKSEPWVISIDKLYLVAGPAARSSYNADKEKAWQKEHKDKQLQALESQWKGKMQLNLPVAGSSSWYTYSTSLLYNIMENLQLVVKDVHIRYEDSLTIPNETFAFGITITSLSAQSTNENWDTNVASESDSKMRFKLIELKDFAMYWDMDTELLGDQNWEDLTVSLQNAADKSGKQRKEHEYLLEPVTAKAKLRRNCSPFPLRSRSKPRFIVDLELDKIPLSLSQNQYRCLVGLLKEFERHGQSLKFRKFRPEVPIVSNTRLWWQFAINSVLDGIKGRSERGTYKFMKNRIQINKQYIATYTKVLTADVEVKGDKDELEKLEEDLTFDEIRLLREAVFGQLESRIKAGEELFKKPTSASEQQGYGSWLWGWGGWSAGETAPTHQEGMDSSVDGPLYTDDPADILSSSPPPSFDEQELIDFIGDPMADSTLLRRDQVFVVLNFNLKGGSFILSNDATEPKVSPSTIAELEFTGVTMKIESRLRTNSTLFGAKLGALYLRDRITKGSLFPVIVSPQLKKDEMPSLTRTQFGLFSRLAGASPYQSQAVNLKRQKSEDVLFEMTYESNPPGSNVDCRLEMITHPLEIVYNSKALQGITDFFNTHTKTGLSSRPSELKLTQAMKARYQDFKNQTRQEIINTMDRIMEGENKGEITRWDVHLDISAPQIIIPDSFHSKDATLVVLDFGHLDLSSATAKHDAKKQEKLEREEEDAEEDDGDLDEDFQTPPNEMIDPPVLVDSGVVGDTMTSSTDSSLLTETSVRDRMYDRYNLDLSDLQIIIGRSSDNWRTVYAKRSNHMQVVEKFSISMLVERRLVNTADPQWPSMTFSGNLPCLSMHVNEKKIQALANCFKLLAGPEPQGVGGNLDRSQYEPQLVQPFMSRELSKSISDLEATFAQRAQSLMLESRLLLVHFSVDKMSLDIQSSGRCIVECQVSGVRTNLTKRPYDTSLSLTIHGLLLIDALQQFGPDFELLVASHKELSMDVPSGSIMDSDPSSPYSAASPASVHSPTSSRSLTSPAESMIASVNQSQSLLATAASLITNELLGTLPSTPEVKSVSSDHATSSKKFLPPMGEDSEALITIELDLISPDCPTSPTTECARQIANVQFNNLDVIANQDTMIELLAFFKRAFPDQLPSSDGKSNADLNQSSTLQMVTESSTRTDVSADFNCLNVVLVRRYNDGKQDGKKVATATISNFHVQSIFGEEMSVEGSLGGMQLVDLTASGKHRKVFSVGQDPIGEDVPSSVFTPSTLTDSLQRSSVDMYRSALDASVFAASFEDKESQAFTFSVKKLRNSLATPTHVSAFRSVGGMRTSSAVGHPPRTIYEGVQDVLEPEDELEVSIHLASLCYTHAPKFLNELSMCVDEFQSSALKAANSLQKAATEAAMDFMRQKSEYATMPFTPIVTDINESPIRSGNKSYNTTINEENMKTETRLKLSVIMETPIMVFPRSPESSEVLVGHLGNITIKNYVDLIQFSVGSTKADETDGIYVSIKDINLFSFNEEDAKSRSSSISEPKVKSNSFNDAQQRASTVASHDISGSNLEYKGTPILHDTSLELSIVKQQPTISTILDHDDDCRVDGEFIEEALLVTVSGKIVKPLKVILSKHVYEQLFETLDNITYQDVISQSTAKTQKEVNDSVFGLDGQTLPSDHWSSTDQTEPSDLGSFTRIHANFDIPELTLELQGDLTDGAQGLVSLSFQNFSVRFKKDERHIAECDVSLQYLEMVDLLVEAHSKHRYLMVSRRNIDNQTTVPVRMVHSTSCPTISRLLAPVAMMPGSLPSNLNVPASPMMMLNQSSNIRAPVRSQDRNGGIYPSTPPPSPDLMQSTESLNDSQQSQDALVQINVRLIDKNCPEFSTKHQSINRLIDVDFNALDTTINLQTLVVLLDFLGMGAKPAPVSSVNTSTASEHSQGISSEGVSAEDKSVSNEDANTEINVRIQSLSLLLNKPAYELAKANVSGITTHLSLVHGNVDIEGSLGSMMLLDLTPSGHMYPEKFVTRGDEALGFKIFKYGQPDPDLLREFDISINLRMSSVCYIHTHRFQMELLAFAQHFNTLQDMLGRMRAASNGQQVKEDPARNGRLLMDISAGSPVILIPLSSKSKETLVANLGRITLKNQFLFAGSPGTISVSNSGTPNNPKQSLSRQPSRVSRQGSVDDPLNHICLLDCMNLSLEDMDLFLGNCIDHADFDARDETALIFPSLVVSRKGPPLLKQTCLLRLQVERNLDVDISRTVPDISISGVLSSVHCSIDTSQYHLIRGMLDHNLGEPLEEFQPIQRPQAPINQTVLSGQVWTSLSMHIDLMNVTLELLQSHGIDGQGEKSLVAINFIKSRFSFESFSNDSKTVDLVSHALRAHDTRQRGKSESESGNVFHEILTPSKHNQQTSLNPLQMELHYASRPDHTRATLLLNNMRVMCILDIWLAAKDFLLSYNAQTVLPPEYRSYFQAPVVNNTDAGDQVFKVNTKTKSCEPKRSTTPISVASGIATKRVPPMQQNEKTFELRLNFTETEFVVVEDPSYKDTDAVILKVACAVTSLKPESMSHPFSCTLQELEVFSCRMGSETNTALSIIDPITVSVELKANHTHLHGRSAGLLDATLDLDVPTSLEVHFQGPLTIRVSYHDVNLFQSLLKSVQTQMVQSRDGITEDSMDIEDQKKKEMLVPKLLELGFSYKDCERALDESKFSLEGAANWLLENATPIKTVEKKETSNSEKKTLEVAGIEVRATSISVCLIDDCRDIDVPLMELSLQNLHFFQKLLPSVEGQASCTLVGEYYNRSLSGWEPFLEPWKCKGEWIYQQKRRSYPAKLFIQVKVDERLDLNLTSALMDLVQITKENWTEDYYKMAAATNEIKRHRKPFVPFALRNETGCRLWFATMTTTPTIVATSTMGAVANGENVSAWTEVKVQDEVTFQFQEKDKMRHRSTRELHMHQVLVKVDGWHKVAPVSVDKVGVYFRQANPYRDQASNVFSSSHPARIVFEVTLEGNARKVITVRSGLMVVSRLSIPMELRVTNPESTLHESEDLGILEANSKMTVPLHRISWHLRARPKNGGVEFCKRAFLWQRVTDSETLVMECKTNNEEEEELFRFCCWVKREAYPVDPLSKRQPSSVELARRVETPPQPGHTLMLLPTLVMTNLLPYEIKYFVKGTSLKGEIAPGKDQPMYGVDINREISFHFSLENFPKGAVIHLPAGIVDDMRGDIRIVDTRNRLLVLHAKVECRASRALKCLISAPYWLINKSGLPLIFKQHEADDDSAGQFEEHEAARSMSPLLYSFSDLEKQFMCQMRLGKGFAGHEGRPYWCSEFSLDRGTGVRSLRLLQNNGRPHKVFHLGIDVTSGKGRYVSTHIVTFVPRFQLVNFAGCKLSFAQRHLVKGMLTKSPELHLVVMPESSVVFHWPRDDLDKLLCVRMSEVRGCRWSGGFRIDRPVSFNINMRGSGNSCTLLHVEVSLRGATYFIVFTNVDKMPPPYKIDNKSEVDVVFCQASVADDSLSTTLPSQSSIAYAWDEPELPKQLKCTVKGGSSAYYKLDQIGEGERLYYENFIYIAMSATFNGSDSSLHSLIQSDHQPGSFNSKQLVLDVVDGVNVVLLKKEPAKRSQLWRMTSTGMLQNEGSCSPRNPREKRNKPLDGLVLDIAEMVADSTKPVDLILRKPEEERKATQTWYFTEDGRLQCSLGGLTVQSKHGIMGLNSGTGVVLGPMSCITADKAPPQEQRVKRLKHRPGSGSLTCKVISDGPSKVLRITDSFPQKYFQMSSTVSSSGLISDWQVVSQEVGGQDKSKSLDPVVTPSTENNESVRELEVALWLKSGIGISVVNSMPEEVLYCSLNNIDVHYLDSATGLHIDANLDDIQIDNQLMNVLKPVVLYKNQDNDSKAPLLDFHLIKLPSDGHDITIYKTLMLNIQNIILHIEELMLLKLFEFFKYGEVGPEIETTNESRYDVFRTNASLSQAKRYFFETIKVSTAECRLTVLKSVQLPPRYKQLKSRMQLMLIQFQDAPVSLDPFTRVHAFETQELLLEAVSKHYTEELKSQAVKILGAVDFLGNPIGLLQDLRDGVREGLEGNVAGLLRNVTHGMSNTTAKMAGTISAGIGLVTMDRKHQDIRHQIHRSHGESGVGHFMAGVKGLGFGVVGGLTSVFTQSYQGASKDGVEGLLAGLGKGIVGTFTKPVAGMFDLASGTAAALSYTTSSNANQMPPKVRKIRCCVNQAGVLPRYTTHDATGQEFMRKISESESKEMYIAFETLRDSVTEGMQALITSECVHFLGDSDPLNPVLSVLYSELYHANHLKVGAKHYVELTKQAYTEAGVSHPHLSPKERPRVGCDNETIALKVSQQINYAKSKYEEIKQMVATGAEDQSLLLML